MLFFRCLCFCFSSDVSADLLPSLLWTFVFLLAFQFSVYVFMMLRAVGYPTPLMYPFPTQDATGKFSSLAALFALPGVTLGVRLLQVEDG